MFYTNFLVFFSHLPVTLPPSIISIRVNGTNIHPVAQAKGLRDTLLLTPHVQSTTQALLCLPPKCALAFCTSSISTLLLFPAWIFH